METIQGRKVFKGGNYSRKYGNYKKSTFSKKSDLGLGGRNLVDIKG